MIIGLGIDSVEIDRFIQWQNYDAKQLEKTFTKQEIAYCLDNKINCAERFAARFAAKEAFFKAFSNAWQEQNIPFLTLCKNVSVVQDGTGKPKLDINWDKIISHKIIKNFDETKAEISHEANNLNLAPEILQDFSAIKVHISITHTQETATAIVIIEKA